MGVRVEEKGSLLTLQPLFPSPPSFPSTTPPSTLSSFKYVVGDVYQVVFCPSSSKQKHHTKTCMYLKCYCFSYVRVNFSNIFCSILTTEQSVFIQFYATFQETLKFV